MDDAQVLKAFQEGIDSILNMVHSLSDNQTVHMKIAALESRLNKNSKNTKFIRDRNFGYRN